MFPICNIDKSMNESSSLNPPSSLVGKLSSPADAEAFQIVAEAARSPPEPAVDASPTENEPENDATTRKPPVEMNTFAQFNIDSSNPVCYPYICRFNLSRLALKIDLSSVYIVVKLETSKRTLRSSEVAMTKVVAPPPPPSASPLADDEGASSAGVQVLADLNMNYSITFPFFPKKETNILYFYIQQRKKYKNRTILGYKTIAFASLDLAALAQDKKVSKELPLLARTSRHHHHHHRSSAGKSSQNSVSAPEAEKKPALGFLSVQSLINQPLETSGELLPINATENSINSNINNFISKNRQLKLLRKELKLLKSKTQIGTSSSSSSSKKQAAKKERSKSEKFGEQLAVEEATNEHEQTPSSQQLQLFQQKIKKPKFKLTLNRRSHTGLTFSDSDELDPGAASAVQTTQPPAAQLASSQTKKMSTISAIRRSIINSGNNFAANSANKNARKLTGRLISFIRKLRSDEAGDGNADGEIEYDENENELFNYEEVYNLCKKQEQENGLAGGCSAVGADLEADEDGNEVSSTAGVKAFTAGIFGNDESEYEAGGEEEVFDSPGNPNNHSSLAAPPPHVHHSHMDLLKDQINNIILNDYSNYNDEDFDEDDLNYDLDNIEQISDGLSNIEDVTDHQDVYSIISTPKPKLLPFFTKSQQELNYKFILEEYQAKDQAHLVSISNSKLEQCKTQSSSETLNGGGGGVSKNPNPARTSLVLSGSRPTEPGDFKSPAKPAPLGSLSNEQKLDRMLGQLTEKRPLFENEYLFLLIEQTDPLCEVLGERVKRLENVSFHDTAGLGEFKAAFYRVLAWLLKNETILINHAENFYFKVLLVGNDQHVNRYLQAFVDLFKLDNEFIYLKYFKHYFIPSNCVSLNSTARLASIVTSLAGGESPTLYQTLFGDKYWLELVKKKRVVSHSSSESEVDAVYKEVWSRMSRYVCAALPNGKLGLSATPSDLRDFGKEVKLQIGQVIAVNYGQKFGKLQLPFLVDVKIGGLREPGGSGHFANFDLIECLTGEKAASEPAPSIFQFESLRKSQQRTPSMPADAASLANTLASPKPSLPFKMANLSPKEKNRFNALSTMSLQVDYSFYESINLTAAKLMNSLSVHSMSSVLASGGTSQSPLATLGGGGDSAGGATMPSLTSSMTVADFGDSDWQNSSLKSSVKKASYKYIQIYRTNLLFSKDAQHLKTSHPSSGLSNQMLNSLSMIHVTNEKKQKIMRLGKKGKDDDQRIEFVDGLVKIVCKTSKTASQSTSGAGGSHTVGSTPENGRYQSPFRVSVDGIEHNNVKYLQVSSQWQTNTELNDLNPNMNKQSTSKQLKYIGFIVV